MRVLLVFPGLHFEVAYPLGLAAVAAGLKQAGHEVRGLDLALVGLVELDQALEQWRPEVVGLALWSPALARAAVVAARVRRYGCRLVLGGPHASLFPAESLRALGADAVVVGDGELALPELLAAWQAGADGSAVPGCWIHGAGGPRPGLPRPLAALDVLPVPDRTVFDPRHYPHTWARRAPHAAPMVTSRGCPLACAHCPSPALCGRRWRARRPADVVAELQALPAFVGHVLFEDEHPTVDRERFHDLCDRLAGGRGERTWSCPNGLRPETLDPDLLRAMARGGCRRIALGVESTDPDLLRRLGRCSLEQARQAARAARAEGIEVTVYFMLGLPGETAVEPRRQLAEAVAMGASGAHFSLYQPVAGAELFPDEIPPPPTLARGALYLAFYGHPGRLRAALRAAGASVDDLPAALERLSGWLRYGRRPERAA